MTAQAFSLCYNSSLFYSVDILSKTRFKAFLNCGKHSIPVRHVRKLSKIRTGLSRLWS